MKQNILIKFIAVILMFLYWNNVNAYTSSELITLYSNSPDTWTSLYEVPEWYDFIINRINSDDLNEIISLRNLTNETLAVISWKNEYLWWHLVIKDELQIISTPWTNVNIMIFWFLVNEDEDIENYIEGNSNAWSKNIFTKEDIDFIYFREFIFFIFLLLIKFFEILIWRKMLMR